MRRLLLCLALCLAPLAAHAGPDIPTLEALRDGSMKKLNFWAAPKPVPETAFSDIDGGSHQLSDYAGKVVLVNFWATWCAPCRAEMPGLSALQTALGGEDFQVVTLATGRNGPPAIRRFFDELGVTNLPLYADPKQALARDMAVLGLPATVILDRQGHEIARLTGDADWDSDSAKAILAALVAGG